MKYKGFCHEMMCTNNVFRGSHRTQIQSVLSVELASETVTRNKLNPILEKTL